MTLEIERKFLLSSNGWRGRVQRSVRVTDGLIAATDGRKTRVRIAEGKATLAVKTKRNGTTREEFEYEIPLQDAARMLEICCGGYVITKLRHFVEHQGHMWEIDEYEDVLQGVILAEVELDDASRDVPLPDWVGAEVTSDSAYKKINMFNARLKNAV